MLSQLLKAQLLSSKHEIHPNSSVLKLSVTFSPSAVGYWRLQPQIVRLVHKASYAYIEEHLIGQARPIVS